MLDDRFLATGILRIVRQNFERMQVDIAVGAIPRAQPAANAPVLDDHFERVCADMSCHLNGAGVPGPMKNRWRWE